jgi:hypothetical protein
MPKVRFVPSKFCLDRVALLAFALTLITADLLPPSHFFSFRPSSSNPARDMPMPKRFRRERHDNDPLDTVTAPPPGETPAEREERLLAEQRAKQVSDAIDEEINRERIAAKRGPKAVKILLLGTCPTRLAFFAC